VGGAPGILDWYTLSIAVAALMTLAVHGALWVALKTEGPVEERARRLVRLLWWGLVTVTAAVTLASFSVQPHLKESFGARPWGYVFPLLAVAGLAGIRLGGGRREGLDAFLSSCVFILGMLCSLVFGVYPDVLPSNTDAGLSLTIQNSAASRYGLTTGLFWFIPGMILATGYFTYTYRNFAGKVKR